jgi:hypothetical protein
MAPAMIGISASDLFVKPLKTIGPDRINPVGSWSFSWLNSGHTQASATWVPESGGQVIRPNAPKSEVGGGGLAPDAAGLGAYIGTAAMVGTCSVAAYQGMAGNPTVIATGLSCASALQTQVASGNLGSVLAAIAWAESGEMDAMSGGLANIGNQLDGAQGTGSMMETSASGWTCSGTSGGSWGNGDSLTCTSGSGPGGVTINLNIPLEYQGVHGG